MKRILCLLSLLVWATTATAMPDIYYIHSDHLGAPRVMTDENQKVVWTADYDPFGKATVIEDPDGDGNKVNMPLRLPGQYYDKETGLHYNYFRDYDSTTGRYIESDPIGILYDYGDPQLQVVMEMGLVNPIDVYSVLNHVYNYTSLNPVNWVDPTGLACFDSACIYRAKQAAQLARQNKIKHIFGNPKHKLDDFVKSCKNKDDALDKLQNAFKDAASGKGDGLLEVVVDVNGFSITIRGNIVKGAPKLGTAFLK